MEAAHAGTWIGTGGVLVLTWEHGGRRLDTGVRGREASYDRMGAGADPPTGDGRRTPDNGGRAVLACRPHRGAVCRRHPPGRNVADGWQAGTGDSGARRTGRPPALLVLEDGRTFRGTAYGAVGETVGEAVFNTGMTGYQETLTDPSYHRQVVAMTVPHIGNTGVNDEDPESGRIWVAGYVVRDPARGPAAGGRSGASTRSSPRRGSSASAASTPAR